MKKQYAIIIHDRHTDDRVHLFNGTDEEVKLKCEELWKKYFSFEYRYPYSDGSGDYYVDYTEVII